MADDQASLTWQGFIQLLRRRLWVIVLALILVPGLALAITATQEKRYTATASLLLRDVGPEQDVVGNEALARLVDPERAAATNTELLALDVVAERTAEALGPARSAGEIASAVEVQAEAESNLRSVTATDTDPELAANLANAYAREYIAFRRETDRDSVVAVQRRLERQIEVLEETTERLAGRESEAAIRERRLAARQVRQFRAQVAELETLASLQSGNAELVQDAKVPGSPSSPKPLRALGIGVVVGLLLGVGLAMLFDVLDRRLREPGDVEDVLKGPVLAGLPYSSSIRKSGVPDVGELESFRMLHANLKHFHPGREVRTVLVTSAAPGEGKSTVAWNLARAAADAGERVLLIEAELRHGTFGHRFDMDRKEGLTQILTGEVAAPDAICEVALESRGRSPTTMDVIFAGELPPNPRGLLDSPAMRSLIDDAPPEYAMVVIDAPPLAVVSDAIPLVAQVDGVIVVARLGVSTVQAGRHLREQLDQLEATTLGVVINGIGRRDGYYPNAYGYTKEYASASHG